ncbi:MAG: hypothetical protein ACRC5C_10490, partial [Bacilli bacterium]
MVLYVNNNAVPIELYFTDPYGKKFPVTHMWSNMAELDRRKFVTLKENMDTGVVYRTSDSDALRTGGKVTIEMDEPWSVQLGVSRQIHWINQGVEDYPWAAGDYLLEMSYGDETFYSGIAVSPLHLDEAQLERMHRYLEEQCAGLVESNLAAGVFRPRVVASGNVGSGLERQLSLLEHHLDTTFERIVVRSQSVKKPTLPSIRRDLRTGQIGEHHETRVITQATPLNAWLKYQLLCFISSGSVGSDVEQQRPLVGRVRTFLGGQHMRTLQPSPLRPVQIPPLYLEVEREIIRLMDKNNSSHGTHGANYRLKKTWRLYEYYCLFQVLDCFLGEG